MTWKRGREAAGQSVTRAEVKLCALCGALNHQANHECFTCGWHGDFSRDADTVALAYQRLYDQFEDVRMEHVTGKRQILVSEFGVSTTPGHSQRVRASVTEWWRAFLRRRVARAAVREAAIRPRPSISGNELGV